jgi:hypothetical protein
LRKPRKDAKRLNRPQSIGQKRAEHHRSQH